MKIIPRYIKKSVIQAILLVLFALMGVQCFIALINVSGNIGKHGFGVTQAILYVLLTLPASLYQMFPMIGFVGCLLGLGSLSTSSELIVIRASGVSVGRIALSVIMAALTLIVFVTIIGGVIAPRMSDAADKLLSSDRNDSVSDLHNVWLHQGNVFLHIGHIVSDEKAIDINEFDFDENHHITKYITGNVAFKRNNGWVLPNAEVTTFNSNSSVSSAENFILPLIIQPKMLVEKEVDAREESVNYLWRKLKYLKKVGLDPGHISFAIWQHIMQPFTTIIMICLGVPFTLGSLRDASGSARMVIGVLVGFGFYMLNEFVGPMALIYQIPSFIAATLPSLLFLGVYLVMLRRID